MVEGLPEVETAVITESSLATMLDGVPLREAIGATFFLQVGALQNGGVYEQSLLNQPNLAEVLRIYPRSYIEKMADRLTTTPEDFRAGFKEHSVGTATAARFDYNPLVATPFVDLGDGPVAPATRLILRTVTPGGLYYAGLAEHGTAFAEDLGHLLEHYIGRQPKLIDGAAVEPEIVFGKGGGTKSVDWFVGAVDRGGEGRVVRYGGDLVGVEAAAVMRAACRSARAARWMVSNPPGAGPPLNRSAPIGRPRLAPGRS